MGRSDPSGVHDRAGSTPTQARVVLDVLAGWQAFAEACRGRALSSNLISAWKAPFVRRGRTALAADDHRFVGLAAPRACRINLRIDTAPLHAPV